jgi:hypothetical protein
MKSHAGIRRGFFILPLPAPENKGIIIFIKNFDGGCNEIRF